MKRVLCLFGIHGWRIIGDDFPRDQTSRVFGRLLRGEISVRTYKVLLRRDLELHCESLVRRCSHCGKVKR